MSGFDNAMLVRGLTNPKSGTAEGSENPSRAVRYKEAPPWICN